MVRQQRKLNLVVTVIETTGFYQRIRGAVSNSICKWKLKYSELKKKKNYLFTIFWLVEKYTSQ